MLEAPAHRAAKQNSKTRALTQAKLAAAATAAATTASMAADRKGEVPTQKDHAGEISNGIVHDSQPPQQDHDVAMKDANAQDHNEKETHSTGTRKGIDQEDLDGGLLDGALDDVEEEDDDEDLGHDTEDTEVGHENEHDNNDENENGFSDEDELMNGPEADEEEKEESPSEPNGVSSHETQEEEEEEEEREDSHVATTMHQDADLEDVSMAEENDESAQAHSDDSDSDHPGAEGSEHEGEEEDDDDDDDGEDGDEDDDEEEDGEDEEEGSAALEDDDDNEDEEEEDALPPPPPVVKKEITLSQKPTLNRPQIIEEELKDSGDELSDLSEFDDTDDSDEDDEIAQPKTKAGPSSASGSGSTTITTSTRAAAAAAAAAVMATSVSARAAARGLGRKKSLRETSAELKQEEDKAEAVKLDEEAQKTGSRTRQGGSPKTGRSKSKAADVQQPDKGSGSEAQGEEEGVNVEGEDEEEEEAHEDEEEDLEAKQVHREALEALTSIEIEFATLRDRMYDERMLELDREVEMINLGTHPELSSLMLEIHEKREQRLQIARAWRTHKGEIAQCQFEIAEYQAHCTFQSSRRNTRADLTRELGHRQRTLILDLTRMTNDRKRKMTADKVVLVKARKQKRIEANNLSLISERRGFPINSPLRMVTTTELDEDFSAMGLPRPVAATIVNIEGRPQMLMQRTAGQVVPVSVAHPPTSRQHGPVSGSKWAQSQNDYSTGDEKEVEIHSDAPRCNVDGIWYKPNDAVVVLDAALGKYSAKYLYLSNDEILLQKTDGSKTRLPLNLFRSKKLYMQPRS
ncbi:hypothetical protein BGZ92_007618 [Podila epicladia]|nr:hypothetical protein BGZ92_007618 [Podila epicladia]